MKTPSLLRALVVPIALISVAAMALLGYSEHLTLQSRLDRTIAERAETIANMIGYAAETVGERGEVHRIVSAAGAEREIRQILVIAGRPARIVASTRHEWLGKSVTALPDLKVREALIGAADSHSSVQWIDRANEAYYYATPIMLAQSELISTTLSKGAVLVEVDLSSGHADVIRSAWLTFLGRALLLLITIATIMLLLRHHVLKPVNAIQSVLKRRAEGLESDRVPAQGTAELSALSARLNDSFDAVEESRRQLRTAEEFMRSVLDQIPAMVAVKDSDDRYVLVNRARATFLETSEESLVGMIDTGLSASRERDRMVLDGTVEIDITEERMIDRKGHTRWLHTTRRRLPRADGRALLLVMSFETTERKRVLQELQQAKDAAEAANRTKSEFLATMSHEIRTPMNGVLGFSELLLQMPLTADQRECVETIHSSGENLLGVINDILDFSKMEAGKLAPERVPFDASAVVEKVASLVRPRFSAKGLQLSVDYPQDCPRMLDGDAMRVRQVLLNLVGNALKFTERGSVSITARPDGDDGVVIQVTDTGIGIPEAARDGLFEKFFQADSTTTRRFGGTGLGLAISKQLIDLMGGAIGADSICGQGSTFWFRLPRATRQEDSMTADKPPTTSSSPDALLGAGCTALLVEDHPVNMMLARRFLEQLGLRVDCVADGQLAVERAREQHYSMIFMDCHMPELDGFAATEAIRKHDRELGQYTPIVAITASAMPADRERCFAVGMDDFISKPVSAKRMREVVAAVIARRGVADATSRVEPDRVASSHS